MSQDKNKGIIKSIAGSDYLAPYNFQLFQNHPLQKEATPVLRKWTFWSFLAVWFFFYPFSSWATKSHTISGPYPPIKGLRIYHQKTKLPVYRGDNSFGIGWCTWFVAAVFPEPIPMKGPGQNDAANWIRNFRDAGYVVRQTPSVGSIAVWGKSVGRGHGHVAYVTYVYSENQFEVWDSNWSKNFDKCVRHRMVYRSPKDGIIGFILPKSKAIPITDKFKTGMVDLAIVFDCSNSMVDPPSKMERAKQAAFSVIDAARRYDQIALVSFAYRAWLLAPATSIGNLGARSALKNRTAAIAAEDYTDIDAGLTMAYQQLKDGHSKRFRAVILLTDGEQCSKDRSPFSWNIVAKYAQAGIPIYTVAYGANADKKVLLEIAKRTGGVAYLAGASNLTQVYQRIAAMAKKASVLTSYQSRINQGDHHAYPVLIPDDIRRAWFGVDWEGSRVEVSLVTPSGTQLTPASSRPNVRYTQDKTYCLYVIDKPQPGTWQVKLYGAEIPRTEQVNLTVSGESPLWANSLSVTPYWQLRSSVPITIQVAEVSAGKTTLPATAQVTATVRKPKIPAQRLIGIDQNGKVRINFGAALAMALDEPTKLRLYDDGSHGDTRARDGVYTNIYRDTDRNGPYEVEIDCQAKLANRKTVSRTLHESFYVGDPRTNKASLLDLLALIR